MKTVVFHLQAKTCEKDISKLKEEILSYNIRIEEKELSEVKEEKDSILAITDQFLDVDYAKEHNIAVIFYETPGTNRSVSGVDMVVQGFEELNVEYLQLIIATSRIAVDSLQRRIGSASARAWRGILRLSGSSTKKKGCWIICRIRSLKVRKEEKIFVIISAACTVFIITGSGQCSSEKAVQLSEESALKTENIRDRAYWNLAI